MKKTEADDIEGTLGKPIDLELSLNELKIIVGCMSAVSYKAEADGESYLDPDGKKLMERLEGLFRDQIRNEAPTARDMPNPGRG